jgi:hypothetical protein
LDQGISGKSQQLPLIARGVSARVWVPHEALLLPSLAVAENHAFHYNLGERTDEPRPSVGWTKLLRCLKDGTETRLLPFDPKEDRDKPWRDVCYSYMNSHKLDH